MESLVWERNGRFGTCLSMLRLGTWDLDHLGKQQDTASAGRRRYRGEPSSIPHVRIQGALEILSYLHRRWSSGGKGKMGSPG